MSMSKMNMLHLHLTDSQYFPIELKSYPNVTKAGRKNEVEYYDSNTVESIVTFGRVYGVIVVSEVDSPTHSASWSRSEEFNETNSCTGYPKSDWATYCVEPPCG